MKNIAIVILCGATIALSLELNHQINENQRITDDFEENVFRWSHDYATIQTLHVMAQCRSKLTGRDMTP